MATRSAILATSAPITITLNSLANGSARESTAIDNSSNLYLDVQVCVTFALAAGSPASDQTVYVYAYTSEDGTNFSDNATGSDAALTMRSPTNLRPLCALATPTSGALTYRTPALSLAAAFGFVPRKWGLVVENKSGLGFGGSGCGATYTGYKEAVT